MSKVSKEKLMVNKSLGSIVLSSMNATCLDDLLDQLEEILEPLFEQEECSSYQLSFAWADTDDERACFELSGQRLETNDEVYARRKTILEQKKMAARARLKNIKDVEAKEREQLAKLLAKYGAPK